MAPTDKSTGGENVRRVLQRDPNPYLFRPLTIRAVTVKNRIMLSPMCQYWAEDGCANDWHLVHLGARAVGGAGIVSTEAVHTAPAGRITKHCLGLWNDTQRDQLARIAAFVAAQDAVPAIQLGHAGRKASVTRPWEGTAPLTEANGGWQVVGPSALPYADSWPTPKPMTADDIKRALDDFTAAARRAREAGFQILEIHAAHGYLLHQFLSPLSNRRDDDYGGSFENRTRFLLETIEAARSEWAADRPLFLRLSVSEWVDGGWTLADSIELCREIERRGDVDLIDCSSGGNDPRQEIPIHPGYQLPFARDIKKATGMKTGAIGLLHSADLAEALIANEDADLVVLGRAILANPHWPLAAANSLKATNVQWPVQYERSNIF